MIAVVPDTNIILRGMFGYTNQQRKILSLGISHEISLLGSNETFLEFCEKVKMPRLKRFWEPKNFTYKKIIEDYKNHILMYEPKEEFKKLTIPIRDPKDAIFFKIALSYGSKIIVSEDDDLLVLNGYSNIRVITSEKFIKSYLSYKKDH